MYAGRNPPEAPPCKTCRVEIQPENEDIVEVYLLCRRQVVTMGQNNRPIDVSIPAVVSVMGLLEVRDKARCLREVVRLWREVEPNKQ